MDSDQAGAQAPSLHEIAMRLEALDLRAAGNAAATAALLAHVPGITDVPIERVRTLAHALLGESAPPPIHGQADWYIDEVLERAVSKPNGSS